MAAPTDLSYTSEHEWIRIEGDLATVGITDFAAEQLGDVVFVELPSAGTTITAGTVVGEIESTKSVGELFAPFTGEVLESNAQVVEDPSLVNSDPYGAAWMLKLRIIEPAENLLDAAAYDALVSTS